MTQLARHAGSGQLHRATIHTRDGWWFHYIVHRTVGVGVPEKSTSVHRSLAGARRAATRWCAKTPDGVLVERVGPDL